MVDPPDSARVPGTTDAIVSTGITPLANSEFRALRDLIYDRSGITLSDSKTQLVASRLARRLRARGLSSYGAYYDLVMRADPDGAELRELLNAITTNKTDFFREKHHFDFLRSTFLPQFVERARQGGERRLRVWSAGCSTGEEPYTLAMTILPAFPPDGSCSLELLATDLDTHVLDRAGEGIYAEESVAPVSDDLQQRYLRRGTGANVGKVRIVDELRQLVTFRQLNFVERPWPVSGPFDLIFCRNVMIYFNGATQREIVEGFAERLRPNGYLFIGHSETLNGLNDLYEPMRGTIYRRRQPGETGGSPPQGGTTRPASSPVASVRAPQAPASSPPRPGLGAGSAPGANPVPVVGRHSRTSGLDGTPTLHVIIGGVRASREPVQLRTLLGSCVCACLYDPVARIGGINHFMLPDGLADDAMPTRFGVNAMEVLINELLKLGGDRRRFQAKAFGAAHVLSDAGLSPGVPRTNARFIKEFLATEGIPLVSSRLGGSAPVEVLFATATGKALVRALGDAMARDLAREETRHDLEIRKSLSRVPDGSVELF
jgi:chemotaxis protein methyltransferase CheR